VAAAAAALAVGGCGLALADVGGVSIPQLGVDVPVPPEKAGGLERLVSVATTDSNTERAGAPSVERQPIPAEMLGADVPVPVAPSVLRPLNGWLVSDGKTLVAVYAGAAGGDPSLGRVVIVRQDLAAGVQTVSTLDAGSTGPLRIVSAPLGSSVERSAQKGRIRLRTTGGRLLGLDLAAGRLESG
jgi:hypothetical protein